MTPNTYRKRLEVLRQRAVDAQPMEPAVILMRSLPGSKPAPGSRIPEIGQDESTEAACARLGIPVHAGTTVIVINEVDASVPRDSP